MKKTVLFLMFCTMLFAGGFDNFEEFEKFEKKDKTEFTKLNNRTIECINEENFDCAKNTLQKMKRYITAPSDEKVIKNLHDKYKSAYQNKLKRAEKKGKYVNVKKGVGSCYTVYADGEYIGCVNAVLSKYSGGYQYELFSEHSSKTCKTFVVGNYFPGTSSLFIASKGSFNVPSFNEALKMFANYWVNCKAY